MEMNKLEMVGEKRKVKVKVKNVEVEVEVEEGEVVDVKINVQGDKFCDFISLASSFFFFLRIRKIII
jgi:RNase P/RNase MRP subunit p29